MKKRVYYVIMSICLLMLIGGCSKNEATDSKKTTEDKATPTDSPSETTTNIPDVEDFVASDYVTLGQYKGLEVTVTKLNVTDAQIDEKINSDLKDKAPLKKVTDRAVKNGDTVNIDFEGLINGKAFDNGSAKNYDLEIGSGTFVGDFEDQLIGAKTGDKLKVNVTFPETYSAELAGKAAVFNVTINSISEKEIPELTDAYVKKNTDYSTIKEYREAVSKELEASNKETMDNEKAQNVITALKNCSPIKKLPKTLVDYDTAYINQSMQQEAAYYGMDIDAYVKSLGMSQEDYDNYVSSAIDNYATLDLLINAVAQAEKMKLTDDEYKAAVKEYITYYEVSNEEELYKKITEKQIRYSKLMEKAYNLVLDSAVVTYTEATE